MWLLTYLERGAEFDHDCCLLIPNKNKTILCLNDKIYTDSVNLIGYVYPVTLFDNSDIFFWKDNFTVLKKSNKQNMYHL